MWNNHYLKFFSTTYIHIYMLYSNRPSASHLHVNVQFRQVVVLAEITMIMCAISSFKNARFMCRHMLLQHTHTHIIYTCVCFRDDNLLLWLIRHLTLAEFQTYTYVGFVGTYLHQSYGYTYLLRVGNLIFATGVLKLLKS